MEIQQLLDTDSRQALTQMEPVDPLSSELSSGDMSEDSSKSQILSNLAIGYKQRVKLIRPALRFKLL